MQVYQPQKGGILFGKIAFFLIPQQQNVDQDTGIRQESLFPERAVRKNTINSDQGVDLGHDLLSNSQSHNLIPSYVPTTSPVYKLLQNSHTNSFEFLEVLGRGGFGAVHKVRHNLD